MDGRLFGKKRSWILRAVFAIMSITFLFLLTLNIFVIKIPLLWFWHFCGCTGIYQLTKALLFKLDSSLYLGFLLAYGCIAGHLYVLLGLTQYAVVLILLSFVLTSITCAVLLRQPFHLIVAYILSYLTIFLILLTKNLITIAIFIAFVVPFLVISILDLLLIIKRRI